MSFVTIVFKSRNDRGFAFSAGFFGASTTVDDVASRRCGPREVPTFFRGLEDSRAPFEATLTPLEHFARRGNENKPSIRRRFATMAILQDCSHFQRSSRSGEVRVGSALRLREAVGSSSTNFGGIRSPFLNSTVW